MAVLLQLTGNPQIVLTKRRTIKDISFGISEEQLAIEG
jgi:hypothetical protein